jgi:gamma-glutamylcyclotransferase (GGCT)/AIG2-like uncharacterized protein YtfP
MEPKYLFVYGILKRNKSADLRKFNAKFVGPAKLEGAQLYNIGGGVGLRLEEKEPLPVAIGDLFEIPESLWPWLDQIEANGFTYTRKVVTPELEDDGDLGARPGPIDAWTYVHTYPGMKYTSLVEGNDWKGDY